MTTRSRPAAPCSSRLFRLIACAIVALATQALTSRAALAQGTMGTVADPITASELDEYARRLGMTAQQRAALEPFHEEYRFAFSTLRENEIERFLNSNPVSGAGARGGQAQGGRGGDRGRGGQGATGGAGLAAMLGGMDRKVIEDSIRQLESINTRIRTLDNTLFDQMLNVLTEEQALSLPSVRQARERERYRTGVSRMTALTNPATQVDLSEMVADLTLSPQEREGVVPVVMAYETSLTGAVRKLHDSANAATLEMAGRMAELQAAQGDRGGRGGRGRDNQAESFRQIWTETFGKVSERAADIGELNRRTERTLGTLLAPPNARRLRDMYFNRAYPETRASTATARAFDVALEFDDLAEDQRTALQAMAEQYRASLDRLNEQMADLVDKNRRSQTQLDWNNDERRQFEEQISGLRDKRASLIDNTRQQLEATLGPDLAGQLERRVAQSRERNREERVATAVQLVAAGPGGGSNVIRFEGRLEGGGQFGGGRGRGERDSDPFVPAPITPRDLETYGQRLGLTEDERSILSGIHDEYMDRYRELEETHINPVRAAERDLWTEDEQGDRVPPTPEKIDRLYDLRRMAITAINALDATFFDDVQLALLDDGDAPVRHRVQNARVRSVYNRGAGSEGLFTMGGGDRGRGGRGGPERAAFVGAVGGGGGSEAAVDVSQIVEQNRVEPLDAQQLDAALEEYELAATAAFQNLFEATMRVRQSTDKLTAQFTRGERGRDNMNYAAIGESVRQAMETDGRAQREARSALVALNRQTIDRVLGLVDGNSAEQLRHAYNRRAYPEVYRDRNSAAPRITAAVALPDLSDQQREQVQTIAVEFRGAYDALCAQMVELERSAPEFPAPGAPVQGQTFDLQGFQERMRTREKLEFERTDLSDRMLARLRAALTPEQAQRIGLDIAG